MTQPPAGAATVPSVLDRFIHRLRPVAWLRALLEELEEAVLPENRTAVEAELVRLDETVRVGFGDTVDADRAREADQQGIGGPRLAPRSS